MRTTDLFNFNRSSKRLNESLHKTFGERINFESFDTPKLEDARNKLRTQIHTARNQSGFNETVENETLTKAQFMHDAIVAELMDRQEHIVDTTVEEGFGSLEDAVLEVLKRFDENMNEVGGYGSPDAKKIIDLLNQGNVESAIDIVYDAYSDQDGGELRNMDSYIEDLQADFEDIAQGGDTDDEGGDTDDGYALASAGFGSDEDYGDFPESIAMERDRDPEDWDEGNTEPPNNFAVSINGKQWKVFKGRGRYAEDRREQQHFQMLKDWARKKSESTGKRWEVSVTGAPATESIEQNNESINTGDDMRNLREGEIQQASAIVTAKTMVDRVGRWIEELSGMENETLLQLGDSIRDEMGQEQAKAFIEAVAPAIQGALDNLKQTRDTLSTGVRSLASGEQPADMLGAEPAMGDETGMDMAGPDTMNEPEMDTEEDPFAAAEPGAGGMETTGREQRESIDRQSRLMKILAG
jgi:hypothetical protein